MSLYVVKMHLWWHVQWNKIFTMYFTVIFPTLTKPVFVAVHSDQAEIARLLYSDTCHEVNSLFPFLN